MEETTAELTREELAEAPPLRINVRVSVACKTDLGRVRENNEDKFEYYIPEENASLAARGMVFVVCDGMGGHAAGQIASELTCKTFIDVYYNYPSADPLEAAQAAVQAANRYVLDQGMHIPARRGMGTTLSALIICQDNAYVVHVGDSRIYRLRGNELETLTHDHTMAEEEVRTGYISRQEAERHPFAHVLTRAIGVSEALIPDIEGHKVQVGDIFLLCSDGLTNHVADEFISDTLARYGPSSAAWRLVGAALQNGGSDNCTAVIVRVDTLLPLDR